MYGESNLDSWLTIPGELDMYTEPYINVPKFTTSQMSIYSSVPQVRVAKKMSDTVTIYTSD